MPRRIPDRTSFVARTVFAEASPTLNGQIKWHYWPMSDEEFAQAMREVAPITEGDVREKR